MADATENHIYIIGKLSLGSTVGGKSLVAVANSKYFYLTLGNSVYEYRIDKADSDQANAKKI